jgi:N-acetylmuramoyl-L-alanine amidase
MRAKLIGAIAVAAGVVAAQGVPLRVTAVRTWPVAGATRVVVEVSADFQYHTERVENPDRVFFDIFRASPDFGGKRLFSREVGDKLVSRVRVAETLPGVTRIVLDLASPAEYTVSKMGNPSRLVVELRPAAAATAAVSAPPLAPAPAPAASAPAIAIPEPKRAAAAAPGPKPAAPAAPEPRPPSASPASRTSEGKNSLIRALGLKIQRVVVDPGHGGHDQGAVGPRGLEEKELVLDIAKRLGPLIERELGCEVVYTRTDDTFVPLEERTAIANRHRADLFVSLHANYSRYPRIAGVETFYLNFTTSRDALDVAARENASSEKNISELQDVLQKIARQEKIEESRELATRLQSALHEFSAKYNRGVANRGVKKAPFVVLVGAEMPSVLVEVGFLSNPREENLLKRPDHRQKVAEALLTGISRYVQSLSHFQVAQTQEE